MNTNNFKTLVVALEALPKHIKNREVNMDSISEPTCNTAGCFAGLISIVANDIPELKKLYTDTAYNYHSWIIAFYRFLETDLTTWAMMNQKKWRNSLGIYMFRSGIAFGKAKDDKLTHNMIIIHLRKVLNQCIK
jgi:hypothetical protein